MELLLNYDYPGNVRELENILEHALIICQENQIEPLHLPVHIQDRPGTEHRNMISTTKKIPPKNEMEARRIIQALKLHHGNRQKSAQTLGIDRTTLWRKMKRFNILL